MTDSSHGILDPGSSWWGWTSIRTATPEDVWARAGRDITYGELRHEVSTVRTRLDGLGVGPGCCVALQLSPSFTMLWWLFALWSQGIQVLLLDPRMKPAESDGVMARVRPRFHISSHTTPQALESFRDEYPVSVRPLFSVAPADPEFCLLQCTSGATGRPKIVGRTWRSVLADVDRHAANPGMPTGHERVLLLCPPTHGFGLAMALMSLRVGACLVFSARSHPADLLERACQANVHAIFGVPVHFDLLNRANGDTVPPNLRLAMSCGDVLTAAVRNGFASRYGVPLGQAYGMTETGVLATDLAGAYQPPAVGKVLPGAHIKINEGELCVALARSPYPYGDGSTRYVAGWLRTRDRASVDPVTDVLSLHGRADSLVIVGGLKVDLTEIEGVLRDHPDVTDAAVCCHATENAPPVIEAYVATVGSLRGDGLTAWCRARLSDFKIPRRWHIGADVPRTPLGKIDRRAGAKEP